MPNRRSEAFVLFLLVCGLRQSAQAAPKDSLLKDIIQFSDKKVVEAIRRAGFEIGGVHDLQSDRTKTKLLVTPLFSSRSNWIAFAITTNGVTRQTAPPASKVFFDEGGKVVAWFTNMQEGVYFASGAFLHLASNDVVEVSSPPNVGATSAKERGVWRVARFEVDASGSRFGLASRNDRAYLGDIAHPSAVRCVATNFALNKIFLADDRVYLCGWRGRKAGCLILRENLEGFVVVGEFEFPGMNSVVDMDQSGSRVILIE